MTGVIRAELLKLTRKRVAIATAIVLALAVAAVTGAVFAIAEPGGNAAFSRVPTLEDLAAAGGGTEAFSLGASFLGIFVFVLFAANWSGEFSQATFRTLLLQQPRRASVLGGKYVGLLAYLAGLLAVSAAGTWVASLVAAPIAGVSTNAWFTLDAITEHASAYANALIGLGAWATFGMALGVLIRSTPIALAVGIAWAGPIEHITQEVWGAASGLYPGLLIEALALGGTPEAPYSRVILLTALYVGLAIAAALLSFGRRDIVN